MPAPRTLPDGQDGFRELARAVVRRAAEQAKRGSADAICWLQDEQVLDTFVYIAGVDTRAVIALAQEAEQRVIRARARKILSELKRTVRYENQ